MRSSESILGHLLAVMSATLPTILAILDLDDSQVVSDEPLLTYGALIFLSRFDILSTILMWFSFFILSSNKFFVRQVGRLKGIGRA